MSKEEILKLSAEEEEILARLEALRAEKNRLVEEEKQRLIREKKIFLEIVSIDRTPHGAHLFTIQSLSREDVLETWKKVPGRRWMGYQYNIPASESGEHFGRNTIPVKGLETFEKLFSTLPNVEITWAPGVKDAWNLIQRAPAWLVDVEESKQRGMSFTILKGIKAEGHPIGIVQRIPGCKWDDDTDQYLIPLSEGWRIWDEMKALADVLYTDDAKAEILNQLEIRNRLNEIASKKDSDYVWKMLPDVVTKLAELNKSNLPFQNVGVEFGMEAGGRFILGDSTGLGKTRQLLMIALIKKRLAEAEGKKFITVCSVKAANNPNWVREIKLITDEDAVVIRNTPMAEKAAAMMALFGGQTSFFVISHDTMGTYEEKDKDVRGHVQEYFWPEMFKEAGVQNLIVDECHQIRNSDTHRSKAALHSKAISNVSLASATPVLSRTGEWFVPLHMVDPDKFRSYQGFINNYTIDGKIPKNTEHLHELLAPIFLRRRKEDVLPDLPPINRIREYRDLTPKGQDDYQSVLNGVFKQAALFNPFGYEVEKEVFAILAQITRLIQVCAGEMVEHTADKAVELVDAANGDSSGKVLIFSRFKATAYAIAARLGHEAVCTVEKKGNVLTEEVSFESMDSIKRDTLFESIRHKDEIRYVVTTADATEGLAGHNLEYCEWVIFNDPFWTPGAYDQCEGRAYGRLSNPHKIDAIYMWMQTKIMGFMQELVDQKFAVIGSTVDGAERTRALNVNIGRELIMRIRKEMGL